MGRKKKNDHKGLSREDNLTLVVAILRLVEALLNIVERFLK